jgi:hypothetical protein
MLLRRNKTLLKAAQALIYFFIAINERLAFEICINSPIFILIIVSPPQSYLSSEDNSIYQNYKKIQLFLAQPHRQYPRSKGSGLLRTPINIVQKNFIHRIAKTPFLCYKIKKVTEVFRNPQLFGQGGPRKKGSPQRVSFPL